MRHCGDCLFEGVECRYPECLTEGHRAELPDCMMPDGAEPCDAFTALRRDLDAVQETIKTLHREMRDAKMWAAEYAREFGEFKRQPPDFMFPF